MQENCQKEKLIFLTVHICWQLLSWLTRGVRDERLSQDKVVALSHWQVQQLVLWLNRWDGSWHRRHAASVLLTPNTHTQDTLTSHVTSLFLAFDTLTRD